MCPLQRPSQLTETPRLERADAKEAAHRARLEQLRQALRDGTYRPSAQKIADRMIASGDLG